MSVVFIYILWNVVCMCIFDIFMWFWCL